VPGWFVTKEFNNWINISQKIDIHSKKGVHLNSLMKIEGGIMIHLKPLTASIQVKF